MQLFIFLGCFAGSLIGGALTQWLIARSRYKWENERLRAWIEAQAPRPQIDPHRTDARVLVEAESVHYRGSAIRRPRPPTVPARIVPPAGRSGVSDRPPPPLPTSIPGPGRLVEE